MKKIQRKKWDNFPLLRGNHGESAKAHRIGENICKLHTDGGQLVPMKHLELLQLNKTPCFKRANYVSGCCCYSVAKLQPHGLQHARLPCQSANSRSLFKLMSIELTTPSNHLILCRPLLLPPSIFPRIGLFKWVSSSHQVAKVLEFQLQHQSFQRTPRADLL